MMRRYLLALLAVVMGFVPATAFAQQGGNTEIYGGKGGRLFQQSCGPGRILVGLQGSAGVLIDSIQMVCARIDAAGTLSDRAVQGDVEGNNRVIDGHADCPPGFAVISASIAENNDNPHIGSIRLTCMEVANRKEGGQVDVEIRGQGNLKGYRSPVFLMSESAEGNIRGNAECPGFAVGIRGRAQDYLSGFGLICGAGASAIPIAAAPVTDQGGPFANLVGQEASFQTSNFNDRFIRHRQSLGYAEVVSGDLGRDDSTFRIQPGLAGRCISLESHNYPGQFLRHQAWRVKLAANDNSELFKQDATFCMVPGLAHTAGVSFESVNYPHHFIRHRNGELWVDDFDGSDLFRADATFNVTNPGGALMVR